jgi:hypothetical protein
VRELKVQMAERCVAGMMKQMVLLLSTRRASSPGRATNRYMEEQGEQDDDGVDAHGRAGEISLVRQGEGEDGERIREGEDPFNTNGRAYYGPSASVALGFGDAYDLLVWGWACGHSTHGRAKKRREEKRHV